MVHAFLRLCNLKLSKINLNNYVVVTAAVCILHYVIRLQFEALSSSRFQNISNGRCVVTACSAAARKSREGREQTCMSVYHYTS